MKKSFCLYGSNESNILHKTTFQKNKQILFLDFACKNPPKKQHKAVRQSKSPEELWQVVKDATSSLTAQVVPGTTENTVKGHHTKY